MTARDQRLRHAVFMRTLPVIPFAVLLIAWAVGWEMARPALITLPSPLEVGQTVRRLWDSGQLQANASASIYRWVLGFGVGVVSGLLLGVLAGLSPLIARMVEPVVSFFMAISGIVWLPIAIVWFGLGTPTVVFII